MLYDHTTVSYSHHSSFDEDLWVLESRVDPETGVRSYEAVKYENPITPEPDYKLGCWDCLNRKTCPAATMLAAYRSDQDCPQYRLDPKEVYEF